MFIRIRDVSKRRRNKKKKREKKPPLSIVKY